MLFDARLIHGAHPNMSTNRTRNSFFGHYCPRQLSFAWSAHGPKQDFSYGKYADRHQVYP